VRIAIALAAAPLAVLVACAAPSPAPKGWQPMPGASAVWSTGGGSTAQEYSYAKNAYGGSLQDLASQVTINALMKDRDAKFLGSLPFVPCPGAAGVATFRLPSGMTLQQGFSVSHGQAVRVTYVRPTGSRVDPNALEAMQNALCAL
jgi:hypothetical protein